MNIYGPGKMFGVALDVSDDPWNLRLRLASIWAELQGQKLDQGPYDAMVRSLGTRSKSIELAGVVPLASWLGPRPKPADVPFLTQAKMQEFVEGGGLLEVTRQVKEFVIDRILPHLPIMIGVDHSASGGVVSALSKALGPDQLTVVVLDHHFDGLDTEVRTFAPSDEKSDPLPAFASDDPSAVGHDYCCGSFWSHLIDAGILRPEHLLFVGVGDYPVERPEKEWDLFQRKYLEFEERGCGFFPLLAFEGQYESQLTEFLRAKITTPYVYVSLDLDVGSGRCVQAARYMDGMGIELKAIMDVVRFLADGHRSGAFRIAGLDVMEFNMHLLDTEPEADAKDMTIQTAWAFIDGLSESFYADGRFQGGSKYEAGNNS